MADYGHNVESLLAGTGHGRALGKFGRHAGEFVGSEKEALQLDGCRL